MNSHVLANAKAYVALIGAIATALLGVYGADSEIYKVLTVIAAIATPIATWAVPNASATPDTNSDDGAAA